MYIDVTSPAFRKLPVAITEFTGPSGKKISDIVNDDLDFSGVFSCLDSKLFLEASSQPFNPKNWSVLGAELVVKGTVILQKNLVVTVALYDMTGNGKVFKKEYEVAPSLLRTLAHTIANDIYKHITGESSIFRTRIAYVVRQGDGDEIYMMDWDGNRAGSLRVKASILLSPRWSKDGSKLIYSSERDRQWGIYMIDFKKMVEKNVFSAKGTNIAGSFLDDGDEFIMSSSMAGSLNLYVYSMSAEKLTRLTSSRGIDVTPSASPDGNRIAFVSDRGGSPQIFIMNRDGNSIRRLTFNGSYNTSPAWARRGGKIAFSGRREGKNQIFIINPDGSDLTQLTGQGNNEEPSFSPDGSYIVFTSDRDGEKAVYIMRANGEAQKKITPKGMRAFGPQWSPN